MLKKHCYVVLPVLILALAALACSLPAAAENEQADEYVENEWKYLKDDYIQCNMNLQKMLLKARF